MRRSVRKWICCLGAVAIVLVADMGAVHAAAEYACGGWIIDEYREECRTPVCDGVRLTNYITTKRHKNCVYVSAGYSFTIPDTYVEEKGCCPRNV